jgi:outer membrane protein assembly factor BamB
LLVAFIFDSRYYGRWRRRIFMKRHLLIALIAGISTTGAFGQGMVLMPDSTNNRLVAFDPNNGSVLNTNMFALAAGTPIHALHIGDEIWVSEQIGDRISRWSFGGTFLGQIGGQFAGGGLDNIRGMALMNSTLYVTNSGTNNNAPGNALVMFDLAGNNLGNFTTVGMAPSPFAILEHQGGMLVASASANDDVHRFTMVGGSMGTFHNSTGLNFAQQMDYGTDGHVLVAGFSSNNVVRLNVSTGEIISSFAASGARGVYQLGNGNILWTNSAGAHVFDVGLGTSSLVYSGGGRHLSFTPVPEPGSMLALGAGLALLARRRRN